MTSRRLIEPPFPNLASRSAAGTHISFDMLAPPAFDDGLIRAYGQHSQYHAEGLRECPWPQR